LKPKDLKIMDLSKLVTNLSITGTDTEKFLFIDTVESLKDVLDVLSSQPTSPPSLYIDLEGVNLSRDGTISILQIFVHPLSRTYLLDVHTMGMELFSTPGALGFSLKEILESPGIPKVFFDVRNDSDALFSLFGISLAGTQDLQLMELATRMGRKRFVNGLAKCIEYDARMTVAESRLWKATKEEGVKLFAPEKGGSYDVFNDRPLALVIMQYCVQDVEFLPKLWSVYNSKMSPTWSRKVAIAVVDRVKESQSSGYQPHGRQKAIGPW